MCVFFLLLADRFDVKSLHLKYFYDKIPLKKLNVYAYFLEEEEGGGGEFLIFLHLFVRI